MNSIRQNVRIVTQPTLEPLDLSTVKEYLREDNDTQDSVILGLIRTARETVEKETARGLYVTSYRETLDRFPTMSGLPYAFTGGAYGLADPLVNPTSGFPFSRVAQYSISLMRSPLIAVSAITYYDASGVLQTMDSDDYIIETGIEPGRIMPANGAAWPTTEDRPGAVQILYTAGYASRNAIPATLLQAMRQLISHWYENPSAVADPGQAEIPLTAQYLIDKERILWEW